MAPGTEWLSRRSLKPEYRVRAPEALQNFLSFMKKFELPYNFDNDYFAFLNHYQDYFKYIKFIYMPAFKEGNIQNSRETSGILEKTNYTDYNKYSDIIKRFQSLDLDVCILIQKNATVDIIKKYINEFNIKYFVINDDTLATTLKELYSDKIYLIFIFCFESQIFY